MNIVIKATVVVLGVALLGACATTDEASSYRQRADNPQYRYVQDADYIRQYEKIAQRRSFVHVNWINLPMKRVAVEDGR